MSVRITAVRMGQGGTTHEHIDEVKWVGEGDGKPGASSRAAMVTFCDDEKNLAVVGTGADRVRVHSVHDGSRAWIQTRSDGKLSNNLLELPRY